jgi:hypothetical protein
MILQNYKLAKEPLKVQERQMDLLYSRAYKIIDKV